MNRSRMMMMMFARGISLLALTLSVSSVSLNAAGLSLVWDPNTESDLAGYKFYYGTPAGNYTTTTDVGNVTNHTADDLISGQTYSFYVTAYDTSGLESEPSNVVIFTVPDVEGPSLSGMTLTAQGFEFQWSTTAGTQYQVLFKDTLDAPNWQELAVVTAAGSTTTFRPDYNNPNWQSRPHRFYRILELP